MSPEPAPTEVPPIIRDGPNWVEKATLIVLSATLLAAGYAGWQSARLADLTQTAIDDARSVTAKQSADTQAALSIAQQTASASAAQAKAADTSAQIAQQNMIATERAWIGPTAAKIDKTPVAGQSATLTVSYSNTGRQPATDVSSYLKIALFNPTDESDHLSQTVLDYARQCMVSEPTSSGTLFPSVGLGTSTQQHLTFDGTQITQDVIDGRKQLVAYGCIAYHTFGATHHSSYCFYYQVGAGTTDDLQDCTLGQNAD